MIFTQYYLACLITRLIYSVTKRPDARWLSIPGAT